MRALDGLERRVKNEFMKHTKIRLLVVTLVTVATFGVSRANALTDIEVANLKKAVVGVPVPELPATAAKLVVEAKQADREAVAVTVVRAIVTQKASVGPAVVASIAKAAPEVAPAAAAAAAEIAPDQADKVARAAALAAPEVADQIAAAIAKTNPRHAARIAGVVMGALPRLASKIADAVVTAVPSAQASVESFSQIFAGNGGGGGTVTQDSTTRINGTSFPGVPPTAAGSVTSGYDTARPTLP